MAAGLTSDRIRSIAGFLTVATAAAIVFWLTAYPTITWWDSSQYSLAAYTLGVTGPPGSLLLTLFGWPVSHLPLGLTPAHQLNLFAGLLAAVAAGFVYLIALRLLRMDDRAPTAVRVMALVGAALGALAFAFSDTLWEHATKFTPYVLTVVFTGSILWTMIRWWEEADHPNAWRRLAILGLLFGIDFSVHRTNALLLPSALAWILLRHPRSLLQYRSWMAGTGGLIAGLSVHLLLIPLAASTESPWVSGDPSNWTRFWSYVSLEQLGGGFLVTVFPRKADFWTRQVGDVLLVLRTDFFHWTSRAGPLGLLPGLVGLYGLAALYRRDRRLGIAYIAVLLLLAASTILYFNIPAEFFRSLDRHYLPICLTFAVAAAYGLAAIMQDAQRLPLHRRRLVVAAGLLTAGVLPGAQLVANWRERDASKRYFARDFAVNYLEGLPPTAIHFTSGDNDTFPLWYVQSVEGVRPDVQVINLNLTNTRWYMERIAGRDRTFPVSLNGEARDAMTHEPWTDTTLSVPVLATAESLGLPPATAIPDSVTFRPRTQYAQVMLQDAVLLDIVRTNRWARPLTFGLTVTTSGMSWLAPYGRLDGVFWRIVPFVDPPVQAETLRTNLLRTYQYRGYNDHSIPLEEVSRNMGMLYYISFMELMKADTSRGETESCQASVARFVELIPPERFTGLGPSREMITAGCRVRG